VPICAALRQSPHIHASTVASCWQCVGDLIGSGFEPHTPVPEANILPLVDLIKSFKVLCQFEQICIHFSPKKKVKILSKVANQNISTI